jgi:integrase
MNEVQPIRDRKKINAIKKILLADSPRDHLLFVMGINTGLRVSDLLQLKVKDVMADGKAVSAITIREKKTGKQKRFGVNKAVAEALNDYLGSNELLEPAPSADSRPTGSSTTCARLWAWKEKSALTLSGKPSVTTPG